MHLDIVSAEKAIFSGLMEQLIVPGELGELGIIQARALLTMIKPGDLLVTRPGGAEEVYYISGGC